MKNLLIAFILFSSGVAAQEKTLKLTADDFVNGKTITIIEGEYDKIRVENMYAEQVGVYNDHLRSGGKKISKCNTTGNNNSFDIDITCLVPGTYYLDTWACYMEAELTLHIVPSKKTKVSKSGY